MRVLRLLAAVLLLGAGAAQAAPTIPLQQNVALPVALPVNAFTTSYYVDVGPDANQLTITLDGQQPAGADLDLLLRYGSPFPDTLDGVRPPDGTYLTELAQYRSIGLPGLSERISIDKSSVYPVREGRWYIVVVNASADVAGTAQLKAATSDLLTPLATFDVVFNDPDPDCDTAPWNDNSPKAAIGGNSGTTLGQQRRNALLEATRLLGTQLRSTTPIRIRACWGNLFVSGNSATLAQAGPRANTLDAFFPTPKFLPRGQTAYSITMASKLAGTSFCGIYPYGGEPGGDNYCEHGEIKATFNTLIDGPTGLGASSFYYGFNQAGGSDVDFISVAMHEITHGLGFTAGVNVAADQIDGPVGAKSRLYYNQGVDPRYVSYDDIYGVNEVYAPGDGSSKRFMELSDAERATALSSDFGLRWDDPLAVNANGNAIFQGSPAPDNYVRLYCPNPIQPGSTQSHLSTAYGSVQLMSPVITGNPHSLGLAGPMLNAMGWSNDPRTPKSTAPQFSGVYYDPAHPGHGIGFTRIVGDVYFLAFYTYNDSGAPEWYIAIGSVVDGVFVPGPNAAGDSLVRYKYNPNGNPKQQADPSMHGSVRLDFNDAKYAQACSQSPHNTSGPVALMTFELSPNAADIGKFDHPKELRWCMQPIIPPGAAGPPDFSGTWNAGSGDSGWGYSIASYGSPPSAGLFGVLYYPDANGDGRWAFLQGAGPTGTDYNLIERHGYCRACAVPDSIKNGQYDDRVAGTIKLTLNGTTQGQNNGQSIFDLTYQLPPNGQFKRTDSQMVLLSVPGGQ